jgi:sulfide dehydrogenase cytochrome subunit
VEQNKVVVPAKAATHSIAARQVGNWIVALAGMTAVVRGAFAAAAQAPPGASSCSGCHPASAAVETPVSRLVGRPAPEIVAAMQAFRAGQLPATVMDRIAKGFSEDEIASIAAWYAAQND